MSAKPTRNKGHYFTGKGFSSILFKNEVSWICELFFCVKSRKKTINKQTRPKRCLSEQRASHNLKSATHFISWPYDPN
jgi:hypothetical protein